MKKLSAATLIGTLLIGSAFVAVTEASAAPAQAAPAQAAPAQAKAPAKIRAPRWFVTNDANKDGLLSNAEFHAIHEQYFKATDTDNNGQLSPQEVKAKRDADRAKRAADRAKRGARR